MFDLSYILLELMVNSYEANSLNILIDLYINQSISLKVVDDGIGIKDIHNVCNKHYSTKDSKRGLGLYYISEIVCSHRGSIDVDRNSISINMDRLDIGCIEESIACMLVYPINIKLCINNSTYMFHGPYSFKEIIDFKNKLKEELYEVYC